MLIMYGILLYSHLYPPPRSKETKSAMTGILIDTKGACVLLILFCYSIVYNGTTTPMIVHVYAMRDAATMWCLLTILAFLPAAVQCNTKKWVCPWIVKPSPHGGPPTNLWHEFDRKSHFAIPAGMRENMQSEDM